MDKLSEFDLLKVRLLEEKAARHDAEGRELEALRTVLRLELRATYGEFEGFRADGEIVRKKEEPSG